MVQRLNIFPITQRDSPEKYGVTGAPYTTYISTIDVICRDIKRKRDSQFVSGHVVREKK